MQKCCVVSRVVRIVMVAVGLTGATVSAVAAQTIGTFSWQTQPYCNQLTLTVVQHGPAFAVTGQDSLCGAGTAPVAGTAVVAGGSVVMGLTVSLPSGRLDHLSATISLAGLSGPWADAGGHSGTFAFAGAASGAARPEPATPAVITTAQLAPTIYAGTGVATTVARSDHDHDARYAGRQVTLQVSPFGLLFFGGEQMGAVGGCATSATASNTGQIPLALPRGAVLNSVDVRVFDGPGPTTYSLFLAVDQVFASSMGSQTLASATGGGANSTVVTHTLTPASTTTVAAGRTYRVGLNTGGALANGLCAVEVHYTLPPAP